MLIFYTDGACSGNPGPGGYAFVLEDSLNNKQYSMFYNFDQDTTNNRMEMLAVIGVLEYCVKNNIQNPLIYTDSKYVLDGLGQWLANWKKNNWLTSAKKPVKNQDLWMSLDKLMSIVKPKLEWVKGHSESVGNDLADKAAVCAVNDHSQLCQCNAMFTTVEKWINSVE